MIEVERLTKRYGSTVAVDDLSFRVEPGRVTGFLGPNGAGKTTTLRILLGLVHATSGRATVGGRAYGVLDDPVRRVGAVLEATNFHPKRSGRSHLRVLAAGAGIADGRVDEVLREVGLEGSARRKVGGYSLGMRQRLGVAGALLGEPQVLVLDEPANGLDPEGIRWLRGVLRAFADGGGTVFVSSHVLAEVQQVADEAVIIHDGRLVAQAPIGQLTGAAGGSRVRTPQRAELRAHLAAEAIDATESGDGLLLVQAPPERVGELAARHGIVLHELTAEAASLEQAFLELTGGASA